MLENIKSTFILEKLFSHLFDRVELNLVKYNKKLKMALNISLINYRIYNKIIFEEDIVYESNIKGKIYEPYKGRLIYEGGLLKGKRNGKGKEYYSENEEHFSPILIYEGEYLNGEKNGKGKEYNYRGELIFEGEY